MRQPFSNPFIYGDTLCTPNLKQASYTPGTSDMKEKKLYLKINLYICKSKVRCMFYWR